MAAIVALLVAAAAVAFVLLGNDEEAEAVTLTDLRITGAPPGETLLYPDFRPGLNSYVARCDTPQLDLALRTGSGVEATVAGKSVQGSDRISVPVEPGHNFAIRVEEDGASASYRVRCLPEGFPEWDYERVRPGGKGMFVVAFPPSRWIIVFDQEGVPRWWYRSPERTIAAQFTERGTVLWSRSFGDGYGLNPQMAHEEHRLDGSLIKVTRAHGAVVDSHEHYELANGGAYIDSYVPRYPVDLSRFGGPRRAAVVDGEIEQVDADGNLVWSWNSSDHISLTEIDERWWPIIFQIGKAGPEGLPIYDPVHINTIEPWGDQLVTSFRHLDALYGLERSTGEILWKLGGTERPESLRLVGDVYPEPFGGQHDSRIWGENLLSVYDNGGHRDRPPRGVLFRLEPEEGKATFIRQFTDPEVTESRCCGSFRAFAGGWIAGWGDTEQVTAFDDRGRIMFRMEMPGRSYRVVPVLPSQATPADLERGLEAMEEGPGPAGVATTEAEKPPVALLIHGGSWLRGHAPSMEIPVQMARRMGFYAQSIEYPLGDVEAANRKVRQVAKAWRDRGHEVVAFGESAGGQMAALLAAEGRIDFAVGNAPVSNLLEYWEGDEEVFWEDRLGADVETRRELSPALQQHDRPVLVLHSPGDPGVPFSMSVDYARKFPQVRLRRVGGCHILDCDGSRGDHYYRNSRIGLAWLAERVGLTNSP